VFFGEVRSKERSPVYFIFVKELLNPTGKDGIVLPVGRFLGWH
jgi:hypothetical protein